MKAGRWPVVCRRLSVVTIIGVASVALATSPVMASASGSVHGLASHSLEQAKLTASDAAAGKDFGSSVAIDGNTAVVGADGGGVKIGSAYVSVRSGTTWTEQDELTEPGSPPADRFGFAVAIFGETVVVGAIDYSGSRGAAFVFVRSGTTWSLQATLIAADGLPSDYFGGSVAISGSTALIGAFNSGGSKGAAYVFVRSGTTWAQKKKLTASDGAAFNYFGSSVAIDGSTAVVGSGGPNAHGKAYVYVGSGAIWTEQTKLTNSDGAPNDDFGNSVAISGANALIGAPAFLTSNPGAAYIFHRSGSAWAQQPKLTASDGAANDRFGSRVAISGTVAVVTTDFKNALAGEGYVFMISGGAWSEQATLEASDADGSYQFGFSVAVSGTTVIVGAPSHEAAYVDGLDLIARQSPAASPPPRGGDVNQSAPGTPGTRVPAKRRVNRTIISTSEAVASGEASPQTDGWLRYIPALLIR
jgi:FG-GAP repeat protein